MNHVCSCRECAVIPYSDSCQFEADAQQWIVRREEARARIRELEMELAQLLREYDVTVTEVTQLHEEVERLSKVVTAKGKAS